MQQAALCIDVETTGLEPPEAWPVEFASHMIAPGPSSMTGWELDEKPLSWLLNIRPGKPIPPEAKAIHHITDEMIAESGLSRERAVEVITNALSSAPFIAAHNAAFEKKFVGYFAPDKAQWICTWKVACKSLPDQKQHDLQFLRYALDLPADPAIASPPHRAGPDAYLCALLLQFFLDLGLTLSEMADISSKPCLLPWVTFGQHHGKRWADVPTGYLEWAEKHITDNPDVAYTVKEEIWRRRKSKKES